MGVGGLKSACNLNQLAWRYVCPAVGLVGDRLQDYWWVFSGQGESRKLFRILMGFALARIGYLGLGCGVR